MNRTMPDILRLPIAMVLAVVSPFVSAQNCVLPIPFQYEFQNSTTATLSATNITDPCVLTVALSSGFGPTASGFLHYRRALPTTSVRYGFRLDVSALTNFTLANHDVQVFSASSPVVTTNPLPVSQLLRVVLGGGTNPYLRFLAAQGGSAPTSAIVSLSQPSNTIRVEIIVGSGAGGSVHYWINHAFSDPPDGVIDNDGAGLDNAAWIGVIAAEIGLSSPTTTFLQDNAGQAIVFDQIESSDDILFWDDFSSGAQQ